MVDIKEQDLLQKVISCATDVGKAAAEKDISMETLFSLSKGVSDAYLALDKYRKVRDWKPSDPNKASSECFSTLMLSKDFEYNLSYQDYAICFGGFGSSRNTLIRCSVGIESLQKLIRPEQTYRANAAPVLNKPDDSVGCWYRTRAIDATNDVDDLLNGRNPLDRLPSASPHARRTDVVDGWTELTKGLAS